ncbi:MAG: P-loop NTPase [Candidatus Aenigmarchaeota archaeon]|nr:P-loop NTPase [Candidatus Aenigmarchaeota archaeon]
MARVIGIFSGKGGVGKTTLVANLGAALTHVFHKNVVVFDSNIHASHLGLHFGLYDDLPVTLREVLKQRTPITQAVYIHPPTGLRIIPAPLNFDGLNLTKEKCKSLVGQVKGSYDIVILDCAPGLGSEVLAPMCAVDEAVVISTPDLASLADTLKTIELLKKMKKTVLGIVLNRYKHQKYELTPEEVASTTNYNILSVVPEDSGIPESISKGSPVVMSHPNSASSKVFKKLSARLLNQPYEDASLWGKLLGVFKRKKTSSQLPLQPVVQPQESLKSEVENLDNVRAELVDEIKTELKKEIKERIRKRLREKLNE